MAGNEKVKVVLLDQQDILPVLTDWPSDMLLAVCLMQSGECRLLFLREEEASAFQARLQKCLGLPRAEISLFPVTEGFAKYTMLFSDLERLSELLAGLPTLVEEARDYSVNFTYAVEEGFDPVQFFSREHKAKKAKSKTASEIETVTPATSVIPHFATRRLAQNTKLKAETATTATQVLDRIERASPESHLVENKTRNKSLPTFLQQSKTTPSGSGIKSALGTNAPKSVPGTCHVFPEKDGRIVVDCPDGRAPELIVNKPDQIFLHDTNRLIAFKLEYHQHDHTPFPNRLVIDAQSLPESMCRIFGRNSGPGKLEINGPFLYLHLEQEDENKAQLPTDQGAESKPTQIAATELEASPVVLNSSNRVPMFLHRRRALAVSAAVVVLFGLGLQFGGFQPFSV